jgi:hypothetical protein
MIDLHGYLHYHVSEREGAHATPCGPDDAKWEDCLWVALIEFLRALGHTNIPATLAEAEALRCVGQGSPLGFSTWEHAINGVRARYNITLPPVIKGATAIWAALQPGTVAVIMGAGSPGTAWQAGFTSGHAVTYFQLDPTDAGWVCDGLAPASYNGERITKSQLFAYIAGQPTGGAIIAPVGGNMLVGFKSANPAIGPGKVKLAAGHSLINMREAGKATRVDYPWGTWPPETEFTVAAGVDLYRWNDAAPVDIEGNSPPLLGRNEVYIVHLPAFGGSVYMLRRDAVPGSYIPATLPDTTPYSQAQFDAVKDVSYAAGLTAGKALGTETGTALEKARVRSVLGI